MKLQIKIDGKTYEAEVEILDEESSQPAFAPYTPPQPPSVPATGAYVPAPVSPGPANEKLYCSPVNGLVIRVDVVPGQPVQPNQVLVVLEAMKMENNLVAHCAGKIKSVNVAQGDPVKLHQILIELE